MRRERAERRRRKGAPVWAALLLAACATSPERVEPEGLETPAVWSAAPDAAGVVEAGWVSGLGGTKVAALVEEALEHNHDLQAAAARVLQSAASARIAGADRLPQASLSLAADRRKISQFGPQSTGGVRFDSFDFALGVDWELDLWGRLADRQSAALAGYEASMEDYAAARLSLAAQVAKAWFNLVEAGRQVEIARATAASYDEDEAILEGRYRRGLSNGLDLQLVATAAASSRASISARERVLDAAARRLEVLLGRYPAREIEADPDFPPFPGPVASGLPSELLLRRPDLRAAERRVAAAFRETRAARKQLLPSVGLSASGGTSGREFEDLLDRNMSVWNLAANALQPVFQGGRIVAGIEQSRAAAEESLALYRSAALEAFREVETALAAEAVLAGEEARQREAVAAAGRAGEQAWERYRNGTSDILAALSAERSLAAERTRLANTRNLRLQNRIDLHLALGGPPEDNSGQAGTLSP